MVRYKVICYNSETGNESVVAKNLNWDDAIDKLNFLSIQNGGCDYYVNYSIKEDK